MDPQAQKLQEQLNKTIVTLATLLKSGIHALQALSIGGAHADLADISVPGGVRRSSEVTAPEGRQPSGVLLCNHGNRTPGKACREPALYRQTDGTTRYACEKHKTMFEKDHRGRDTWARIS